MQTKAQSVLNMKELRSTCSKGLEVPCQNTFKEKPAFIKRLSSWYIVPAAETTDSSDSHYAQTKVSPMKLLQCLI